MVSTTPSLADQDAVAGALGAEDLRGEGVRRDERADAHHRSQGAVQLVLVVLGLRLHELLPTGSQLSGRTALSPV